MINAILLLIGNFFLIVSILVIIESIHRYSIGEFWGIVIGLVFLFYHLSVEAFTQIILEPTSENIELARKLLSTSIPSLLFGFLIIWITIGKMQGRNENTLDIIHYSFLGFAAGVIFSTIKTEPRDQQWYTFIDPPWIVLFIAPPFLLIITRIAKANIDAIREGKKAGRLLFAGWIVMAITFSVLAVERLLQLSTVQFYVLYPFAVLLMSFSILQNPLVLISKKVYPAYFMIVRKFDGTVVFTHDYGKTLKHIPMAIQAAMEILAETAGETRPPNVISFLNSYITIGESENYYAYLFSKITNISVKRWISEILETIEETGEEWVKSNGILHKKLNALNGDRTN